MKRIISIVISMFIVSIICLLHASADSSVKAPEKVWYKLINHDMVALKWNAVEGADIYILYKLDAKTGKYGKVYETSKTNLTLKKLTADTEYTYAVRAVGGDGRSLRRNVTFRTPFEWIYYHKQSDVVNENYIIYRSHYDGSDEEVFDLELMMYNYFAKEYDGYIMSSREELDSFEFDDDVWYHDFGVWLEYSSGNDIYFSLSFADENGGLSSIKHLYRMNNDASVIEYFSDTADYNNDFYIRSLNGDMYLYSTYNGWFDFNDYFEYKNGLGFSTVTITSPVLNNTNASSVNDIYLLREHFRTLSNIISDDKYIYFSDSPTFFEEENMKNVDEYKNECTRCLRRAKIGEAKTEVIYTFDKEKDHKPMYLIGCNEQYIYFWIKENQYNNGSGKYVFYKYDIKNNTKPERLTGIKCYSVCDTVLYEGAIYTSVYKTYNSSGASDMALLKIETKGNDPTKQLFNKKSTANCSYNFLTGRNEDAVITEIKNGYIYFQCHPDHYSTVYYRIKTDGSVLFKSKKAFKWR